MDATQVPEAAKQRLGQNREPVLDYLAKCEVVNLAWYLEEKIVRPLGDDEVQDHARALKYAYIFCLHSAKVTFVKESSDSGVKTPDLKVEVEQSRFYVEVKKFRGQSDSGDPIQKIVDAVVNKRSQLPSSEVGFVAIDNFDLWLEWQVEAGLTHDHIAEALCELERSAARNPHGWQKPTGVVIAASTTGGVVTVSDTGPRGLGIPHFVWTNQHSRPPMPKGLAQWVASALPEGEVFHSHSPCP